MSHSVFTPPIGCVSKTTLNTHQEETVIFTVYADIFLLLYFYPIWFYFLHLFQCPRVCVSPGGPPRPCMSWRLLCSAAGYTGLSQNSRLLLSEGPPPLPSQLFKGRFSLIQFSICCLPRETLWNPPQNVWRGRWVKPKWKRSQKLQQSNPQSVLLSLVLSPSLRICRWLLGRSRPRLPSLTPPPPVTSAPFSRTYCPPPSVFALSGGRVGLYPPSSPFRFIPNPPHSFCRCFHLIISLKKK